MKPELILIGGGGHCKSCIDVIEEEDKFKIAGIVDLPEKKGQKVLGYEIIASDNEILILRKKFSHFLVTMGQVKSASLRISKFNTLEPAAFPIIVSPNAYISKHAQVGAGTIIMHYAIVNAGAKVGNNCILNTKSLIEHNTVIGDHCHISTSAIANGGVQIGAGTFLGSNAVAKEYVTIGDNCVIGAGVSIMQNIESGSLYVG
jgi:sugar O-acyltransferase (sialic acid O-acetyltransferase NeuD family)